MRPVIAAIRAERSILFAETSVCGRSVLSLQWDQWAFLHHLIDYPRHLDQLTNNTFLILKEWYSCACLSNKSKIEDRRNNPFIFACPNEVGT